MNNQQCSECGYKSFHRSQKLKTNCSICIPKAIAWRKEYSKKHWDNNKNRIKDTRSNWSDERKAENLAYLKRYHEEHRERLSKHSKQYRIDNPELIIQQCKAGYARNRDTILKRNHDYYQNTKEDRLTYAKDFRDNKMAPHYKMWDSIKQRTGNPNCEAYSNYGGRGITLYPPWSDSFKVFEEYVHEHMGPKPTSKHSIDRIDVNGNYEPGNIRWASSKEQANNKRNNIEHRQSISDNAPINHPYGVIITLYEFSQQTGLPLVIVKYRHARYPNDVDWILHSETDSRFHTYKGHKYNVRELALLTGKSTQIIKDRINKYNWSVERAVEEV